MQSMIHSSFTIRAFEQENIPLGGFIVVKEGGEDDGVMSVNFEAENRGEVMSKLGGMVSEVWTIKHMVGPSNARRINEVVSMLGSLTDLDEDVSEVLQDAMDTLNEVAGNISFGN